ncbi:unnamed protein product [Rotaria sp. Silwood1]|nr:unnamed protein product [Rotaria sp. Silwood1]CAF4993769.1 unnamed protein product [Rotaria sp. Silwood1]
MSDTISVQQLRNTFEGLRVLILGDSIMRGLYKDICCLLTDNNRLLNEDELIYRRLNNENNNLFGDKIVSLHINRPNTTLNIEKRLLENEEFEYHVSYIFSSRVWNNQINNILSTINTYNFIIFQSYLWHLSRYNDPNGDMYLKNLDLCLSKFKQLNKKIIWVLLPPFESYKLDYINILSNKINPVILETLKKYSIDLLDLTEFKTEVNIRHKDGIHFNPYGHRCITKKLSEFMMKLKQELSTIGATTSSSSSINNLSLLQTNSSEGFTQDNNKFNGYDNRRKFDNKQQNDYNDK